jgi:fumarate reductase flavoprotein subunit
MVRPFVMQFMTTVTAPELALVREGALLVGSAGTAIDSGDRSYGAAVAAQPDNTGFIVFDEAMARRYSQWPHFLTTAPGIAYAYFPDYRRSRPDLVAKANTVAALGRKRGFADGALEQAVASQQRSFKSPAGAPPPMLQPPFYVLGPIHSYVVLTDGGVKVNERLQVLVHGDRPVARLFAAGSTGQGGVLLEGHGHHLGWAFTSGRIAAQNAGALERRS